MCTAVTTEICTLGPHCETERERERERVGVGVGVSGVINK